MSSPDALPDQEQWRVRICDTRGVVLGGGILLGTQHVLTCAHVLAQTDVRDLRTTNTAPDVDVVIDFVGLPPVPSVRAQVAPGG